MSGAQGDDRHLIGEELDATLVVEAAAGTGKTTELVRRIVRLIETGRAAIEEIVAVTFSEKAAGELKLRLREELERARTAAAPAAAGPESARLERAVERFEESHVSTIHGFCADLLRERPVEARIDPSFQVLTEGQAGRLFAEAFADWLQAALDDPPEGVRRSLRRESVRRFGQDEDDNGPIARLERSGRELLEWRDHPAPWTRPAGFDREAQIDRLLEALAAFAEMSRGPASRSDLLFRKTQELRRVHAEIEPLRARGVADYDGWEAKLCALGRMAAELREGRSTSGQYARGVPRQAVADARDLLVDALVEFRDRADADLAALVHAELQGAVDNYQARKLRAGAVDFLDLLIRARDLVRDRADVRGDFQRRFRYLLVDEFQDTDPLQAELLLLLAAADGGAGGVRPGALFLVGDPKQSIYRFRRADVGVYREICERLIADGARRVRLRTSFRSVPSIQRAVNAAFGRHMTGDARSLQAEYVELRPDRPDAAAQPAVVALPVPRPYGFRGVTATAISRSLPEAVGEFVRWLVQDSGWTVPGEDGAARPIRAGDVCLLFRRFLDYQDDVTRGYVEALESRGLTHLLVGGKAFHEREEVDALRTALTAVEWPDDGLSVFAMLRGPFFALGEEELLAWHALGHGFRPFSLPEEIPAALQPVADALTVLSELTRLRNHRPIAETIGRLLEATRAHAGFVLWRGGEQVLANVLQIAELSRQYEAEGGLSFRGFVDELREAAARAPTPEAPILEEGTDGVRLMTVHKAKGLEFPVVVLADIGCRLSRDEAQRHLDSARGLAAIKLAGWAPLDLRINNALEADRDRAEGVRLAYVAATRARDLLVVPAVGDAPHERGWVHPLTPAIYPSRGGEEGVRLKPDPTKKMPDSTKEVPDLTKEAPGLTKKVANPAKEEAHEDAGSGLSGVGSGFSRTDPESRAAALRLPAFPGKDTVLDRPDGQSPGFETVRPGTYPFVDPITAQPFEVVWWDPLLLDRPGEERRGLRREDLITKDADPALVAGDRARYDAWRAWKASAVARGSVPSLAVVTVSEWAESGDARFDARAAAVEVASARVSAIAPELAPIAAGRRFGILVHAVLAAVPLDAAAEDVAAMALLQARLLGASDEERAAAAAAAGRALAHPLLAQARGATAAGRVCRREVPVSLALDAAIVDGQADLLFDAGDRWMVVDFKTDVDLSAGEAAYRRQVALYVEAVSRATGRAAAGALLRI